MNEKVKKTIAVTGINGFPGERLLEWIDQMLVSGHGNLCERYDGVIALDVAPPKGKFQKTKFYHVDLTETSADQKLAEILARENVSTLLHLAFKINPHKDASISHELHSIGTMYLLNACAQQKIEKIIVHSSTHCYGAFPNNPNFLSEDHPLRGGLKVGYIRDRIDVERQIKEYQKLHSECVVTVLRPCSILGPTVHNFATRYLLRKVCLTPMGFDPLMQLVHEDDVLHAFQLALEKDVSGAFNIVGKGVLPLLTLLRLSGRMAMPIATSALYPMIQLMWQANVGIVPPGYVDFLRYLWVADGEKAREKLGFIPQHTTRETILSFVSRQRLQAVGLD